MSPRTPAIDGASAAGGVESDDPLASALVAVVPAVAAACGLLATACGGVLALRRLSGAFGGVGAGPVVVTAAVGAVLVAVGDLALRVGDVPPAFRRLPRRRLHWTAFLTRLGLLLAVVGVAAPPKAAAPLDSLVSLAALAVALVSFFPGFPGLATAAARSGTPASGGDAVAPAMPPPADLAGGVRQRLERLALANGAECVRGHVTVVVPRGARSGSGHVGFCPPFGGQPTVDVGTDYDAVEAAVSAAEVLPWGIRVECRLDEPAEETIEIPVAILATAPA